MAKKEWRPFRYFNVEIIRVIDGDTVEAKVDLGFQVTFKNKFRLLGVDTPERGKSGFNEATAFTQAWCDEHMHNPGIEIETMQRDSFGRWLAMFRCQAGGEYLNKRLIDEGHSPDNYRGGIEPYLRSPLMLVEELTESDLKEALRLKNIGYVANRTKGNS